MDAETQAELEAFLSLDLILPGFVTSLCGGNLQVQSARILS